MGSDILLHDGQGMPLPKVTGPDFVRKHIGYADVGSHGGIFAFEIGPVAYKYPGLLQIYKTKVTPDLVKVEIRQFKNKRSRRSK